MTDCERHPGRMQEVCEDRVCSACYYDELITSKDKAPKRREVDMSKGLTGRNEHYIQPVVEVGLKQW